MLFDVLLIGDYTLLFFAITCILLHACKHIILRCPETAKQVSSALVHTHTCTLTHTQTPQLKRIQTQIPRNILRRNCQNPRLLIPAAYRCPRKTEEGAWKWKTVGIKCETSHSERPGELLGLNPCSAMDVIGDFGQIPSLP